ncbi:protein-glutamate O-methyltransferase CheR [uncultured Phenylobacterium sp.]|uniref:CheR family methyltransferase n=1 Tax=uncultured Phenylobacterium sp. TaxID=349273 RepID=UPI0025FE2132|nr:protein-glutamate O-methyltransferase CheR [uncultured Phenylobacterium sp.]
MIPPADLAFVCALCLARAGLQIDIDKSYLIESRLWPAARREGFDSPESFIEAVRARGDMRMGWGLVEAMSLPESEFFRDREVLLTLIEEVLPRLARARGNEPVRVWSAACGTGQEVYSLAMLLAEAPNLSGRVALFGSDLSERCLEKAQAGIYSQFEVQRGLPARLLVRHFETFGEGFVLSPRIRQLVRWRRVNLMDDLGRDGRFDLVLCRGALGQLAPEARGRVLNSLSGALAPGGRLVLGLKDDPGDAFTRVGPGIFADHHDAVRSAA